MASCNKCRAPAEAVVTCESCGKAYARCEACGSSKGARRSLKAHRSLHGVHGPEDASPTMFLPVGLRVTCEYRGDHQGTILADDDPRVWHGTLAFPRPDLPDQAAVSKHVAGCRSQGLFRDGRQPVLWDFGKVHWDGKLREVCDARKSA